MHNDARHFAEKTPELETEHRRASMSAYVTEAIRQSLRDQPSALPNNSTVLYHRSFHIGSALADIFAHRSLHDDWALSLIDVIEGLIGAPIPGKTPEEAARRGILSGLCNELTKLIQMGGKGGFSFNFHDESKALMDGVRHGRSRDAAIVRDLTSEEGE